jgi:hypothetical protein
MPSGGTGVLELPTTILLDKKEVDRVSQASAEKPVTVLFKRPLAEEEVQWSSQKKCFLCLASIFNEGVILLD